MSVPAAAGTLLAASHCQHSRMKVGFTKKKVKTKKNKKNSKAKDGEVTMVDAAPAAAAPSPEPQMTDAPVELTAKDKQRQRMELKKALKVQVSNLKSKRYEQSAVIPVTWVLQAETSLRWPPWCRSSDVCSKHSNSSSSSKACVKDLG